MLTYTKMWKQAVGGMGIGTTDPYVATVKDDINMGIKLFKSAAQQYVTRKEVSADLKQGQQFYTFAPDVIRARNLRVNNGSLIFPIPTVESENDWNVLNVIPQYAIFYPQFWFIRGPNEVGIWPIPSTTIPNALLIAYDARLQDLYLDDVLSSNVTFTNGSNTITCSDASFLPTMVGQKITIQDGTDGNWYNIIGYTNSSTMAIDTIYSNPNHTTNSITIGSVPDFPEDYHKAPVFYALEQYFRSKRIDNDAADKYHALFMDLQEQYVGTFGDKESSQILMPGTDMLSYNPLFMPPYNMSQ